MDDGIETSECCMQQDIPPCLCYHNRGAVKSSGGNAVHSTHTLLEVGSISSYSTECQTLQILSLSAVASKGRR